MQFNVDECKVDGRETIEDPEQRAQKYVILIFHPC
jgi:hypothetical protein